jgi:hypothetical protein
MQPLLRTLREGHRERFLGAGGVDGGGLCGGVEWWWGSPGGTWAQL